MKRRLQLTAFRVSLLVTLGLVALYLTTAQSRLVRNLEAKLLDVRLQWRGVQPPAVPVAVVLVDDKSIAELGRWPWSRSRFAAVVRRLHAAGARVIAFDMLFTEPEVHATRDVVQAVTTLLESLDLPSQDATLKLQQTLATLAAGLAPDDEFASAIQAAGNVLLPFSFDVVPWGSTSGAAAAPPPAFVSQAAYRSLRHPGAAPPAFPLVGVDLFAPIAPLGQAASTLGHVKVAFDTDGTLRYEYPVMPYQGEYYPSLALQVARVYLGVALEDMTVHFGQGVQLGDIFVPTDEALRVLVNYYGPPGTFPTYSFVDVLQNRLPSATFRDQIVLIGAGASGLGDTFATPFSAALFGVERHATVIANVLRGTVLRRRDATALVDLGSIVVIGLVLGWLISRLRWLWSTLLALGVAGGYTILNVLVLTRAGLWVHLLFPLLAVGAQYSAIILYRFGTEERQKRLIRQAFQHYLHPAVVAQVAQHPERLKLGGEKKELTVLFSDIRGFSTISERLTPEALVQLLNEYFSAMTRLVLADNGLLDKYIGDAVMAVYGAPLPAPDHAYRACHTALCMLTALRTLQLQWQARGLPAVNIGIGINSGQMIVGNIGADIHLNYTVISDEVNLGSRLEGVNKEYGTSIIISEATWERVRDRIATRELDVIQVKGKEKPTRIFEVLGPLPLEPAQAAMVLRFEEGLQAYRAQRWQHAMHCFQQVLDHTPDDHPSQVYIRRCEEFQAAPPAADWDGVYVMKTK